MSGWVGYNFNNTFAIEGHYGSLGKDSDQIVTIDMTAVGLGLRLKHDFANSYYIAGRAGMERVENEISGFGERFNDTANKLYVGVGGGLNFSNNFAVTAYCDTRQVPFFGEDERVDTLTIGAEYRF